MTMGLVPPGQSWDGDFSTDLGVEMVTGERLANVTIGMTAKKTWVFFVGAGGGTIFRCECTIFRCEITFVQSMGPGESPAHRDGQLSVCFFFSGIPRNSLSNRLFWPLIYPNYA